MRGSTEGKRGTGYHRNSYSKIAPVMHHAAFLNTFRIVRPCVGGWPGSSARLLARPVLTPQINLLQLAVEWADWQFRIAATNNNRLPLAQWSKAYSP